MPPLPSGTTRGGAEGKARPLVSEVRPLNQDQNQDEVPEQTRTNQDQTKPQVGTQSQQTQVEEEESASTQQDQRPSPLKKKVQNAVESRRSQGSVARAATSYLNSSSGLRKAQSVQNLLTDTGNIQNQTQDWSSFGALICDWSSLPPR